ncbi:MAG TPA: hypothetical protein VN673_15425 [Clostridia bacterium]|nr:hypothetical protein [Clostridia bacterium]
MQRLKANPKIEANKGRVALQRGPLVYCLEAVDNNGHVRNRVIPPGVPLKAQHRAGLLGGITVIQGPALEVHRAPWPDQTVSAFHWSAWHYQYPVHRDPVFCERQPASRRNGVWIAEDLRQADSLPSSRVASRNTLRLALLAKRYGVGPG